MAGTVLGILAATLAVERWARLSRRVLCHRRSVVVFLGGHDSLERGITREARHAAGATLSEHVSDAEAVCKAKWLCAQYGGGNES